MANSPEARDDHRSAKMRTGDKPIFIHFLFAGTVIILINEALHKQVRWYSIMVAGILALLEINYLVVHKKSKSLK